MNLSNLTVLITGATSGIGLQLAIRLQALNNKVIICGRKQERLAEIKATYPTLDTYRCDVNDAQQRVALANWAIQQYPNLNVLVNNAGIMQVHNLQERLDLDRVLTEVTTNLVAPIHLNSLLMAHLQSQPSATIINVTSGLAFTPLATVPVYCATKAGLHAYTASLRHQLKDTAVKVFEIIPPAVETALGSADNYDKSNDDLMKVEDFTDALIQVLERDAYEVGIGMAEQLRQQRDGLFPMLNP